MRNKYLEAYMLEFKTIKEYRAQFMLKIIKPILQIMIFVAIWLAIFEATGKETIAGLDISTFITYIILVSFIKTSFYLWDTGQKITEDIRLGNLTSLIIKPVNYLLFRFSSVFSKMSITGVYSLIVFFIITATGSFAGINFYFPNQIITLPIFLISTLLGMIVIYLIYFIVSCTAFWVGETWSTVGVILFIQAFFAGEMIPLSISKTLLTISNFMPFKFTLYTPVMIYLEKTVGMEIVKEIGLQIMWIIILYFIARKIYKKGLKKFESQGG